MNSKNKTMVSILTGVVILLVSIGFVYFLVQGSYAKPTYSFTDNKLKISGQFGSVIDLSGANVVHELSLVPATETRTNGAAIGKIKKGQFKMGGVGVYLNVMDKDALNHILITDKSGSKFYINCATDVETDSLYTEILKYTGTTN